MRTTSKLFSVFSLLALCAGLFLNSAAAANESTDKPAASTTSTAKGKLVHPTEKDAAWLAKAKAEYPATSCMVSGDSLTGGDMGAPQDFIYREAGKPDRLIRFCCKDCIKDFKKDPAKYLNALDEAAAKKAKGGA